MFIPWDKLIRYNWLIVGMNHYRLNNDLYLYVAMMKERKCIVSQGIDELKVFIDLERQAGLRDKNEIKN